MGGLLDCGAGGHRRVALEPAVLDLGRKRFPRLAALVELGVVLAERHFQSAWGSNKKAAEQEAARIGLELLQQTSIPDK